MLIALFYLFLLGYAALFGWIFNLDFVSFNDPIFYLLAIVSLIIGAILGFASVLVVTSVLGEFRKGKPFDNKFNHHFANALLQLANHIGRIKVTVTGLENIPATNDFVFVSNHQENYDIMILKPIFKNHPIDFIAKESLFKAPIIGKWIGLLGNVPIGKYADREAAKSIITGIKRYKSGLPMAIFPEGKRSRSNDLIDFKPGAFKLAMKPQANILVGTFYDVTSIFKKFPWRRYDVRVQIHPIIKYETYKDWNSIELAANVKNIIQNQIDKFAKAKQK